VRRNTISSYSTGQRIGFRCAAVPASKSKAHSRPLSQTGRMSRVRAPLLACRLLGSQAVSSLGAEACADARCAALAQAMSNAGMQGQLLSKAYQVQRPCRTDRTFTRSLTMRAPAMQIIEHSMRIHSAKCMIRVKDFTCYTLRDMSIDTAAIRWRQRAASAVTDNIDSAAAGSRRRQAPAGAAVWATGAKVSTASRLCIRPHVGQKLGAVRLLLFSTLTCAVSTLQTGGEGRVRPDHGQAHTAAPRVCGRGRLLHRGHHRR